jgi:hypothetical protein
MSLIKTMVCFANSKKYGHRCVAGKELRAKRIGQWIRPVTQRPNGEVAFDDMSFESGEYPLLLDIVNVPLVRHIPGSYQTENYLIDERYYWVKKGTLALAHLPQFCDTPNTLWINGSSSFNGHNDAVSLAIAEVQLTSSLCLIQPSSLQIHVTPETFGRKVRAEFVFGGEKYKLAVTDPVVEQFYLQGNDGIFRLDDQDRYLCVSLGEPVKGICYKLVAAIMPFP